MATVVRPREGISGYPPPEMGEDQGGGTSQGNGNLAAYRCEKLLNRRNVGIGGLEPGAHGIH